jgi:hypothetical protein
VSFSRLLSTTALCSTVALSLLAGTPRHATAQFCNVVPGECCAARPTYADPNYSFTGNVVVGTREAEPGTDACVTIFDITQPYPGDGVNYASVLRYHGPGDSWNQTNLGSVFGLTIDQYGNLFVCQTTSYNVDALGPGGAGAVYRISNSTGAITTFVNLPNSFGVGLGNISYDCEHDQFFVTNHEDGKIYRVKATTTNGPIGAIQESFDPLAPDDGTVGFAPLGERLWGVQWHAGRVYYSVWSQNCNETSGPANSIRSVALTAGGAFISGSDQLEITMPPHVGGYSHPVSDISFTRKGTMLLAERSMMSSTTPAAHESRLLEYACLAPGGWAPSGNNYVLGVSATCCCTGIAGNGTNSAGGVDSDFLPYVPGTPNGRVWGTSDAINGSLTVYGIQGLPPFGGNPANSAWLDFDGSVTGSEKTNMGDVEVPCPDVPTASLLSLFTARPAGASLELRWQFGVPQDIATVELERAELLDGPWAVVSAERQLEGDVTTLVDRDVQMGHTYYYQLVVRTNEGQQLTFGPVIGSLAEAIAKFSLAQVTANPSNSPIQLEFSVPREAPVRVTVLDVSGRVVETLATGTYAPGRYTVTWNWNRKGGASRSGVYFVRYQTPAGDFTRRVVVRP